MGLRPQSHTPFGPVVQGLGGDEVGGHGAEVVIALGDFVLAELGVQQELGHDVASRLSVARTQLHQPRLNKPLFSSLRVCF